MKPKTSNKHTEMEELLDSDDELPDNYTEAPYIPAYQNDDRFKTVNFNLMDIKRNAELSLSSSNTNHPKQKTDYSDNIIKKGIMNKKDIFLSECIATYDDTTLLWFVNFLMKKDLQSNYKFLTSCLVPNTYYEKYNKNDSKQFIENNIERRYKIVVRD